MTEIDYSKMRFTPPKLEDYLVKNNLKLTFVLLMHGSTTSIGRYMLLKEKTERIRNLSLSDYELSDIYKPQELLIRINNKSLMIR